MDTEETDTGGRCPRAHALPGLKSSMRNERELLPSFLCSRENSNLVRVCGPRRSRRVHFTHRSLGVFSTTSYNIWHIVKIRCALDFNEFARFLVVLFPICSRSATSVGVTSSLLALYWHCKEGTRDWLLAITVVVLYRRLEGLRIPAESSAGSGEGQKISSPL